MKKKYNIDDLKVKNQNGVYYYLWELNICKKLKDALNHLMKNNEEKQIDAKSIIEIARVIGLKDFTLEYPNYSQCHIDMINASVVPYPVLRYINEK